jgi:hypothetical protein
MPPHANPRARVVEHWPHCAARARLRIRSHDPPQPRLRRPLQAGSHSSEPVQFCQTGRLSDRRRPPTSGSPRHARRLSAHSLPKSRGSSQFERCHASPDAVGQRENGDATPHNPAAAHPPPRPRYIACLQFPDVWLGTKISNFRY